MVFSEIGLACSLSKVVSDRNYEAKQPRGPNTRPRLKQEVAAVTRDKKGLRDYDRKRKAAKFRPGAKPSFRSWVVVRLSG